MDNSKLESFAAQKGINSTDLLNAVEGEFIGPNARWFKSRFAVPGRHWHWPSIFLLSAWYGWRKMYAEAALSGFGLGFGLVVMSAMIFVLSEHFLHFPRWVITLWWIGLLIYGAKEFSLGTVDRYRHFVARRVRRIIDESATVDEAIHRSNIAGGTNPFGILVPIIPTIVGLFLALAAVGLAEEWTGWKGLDQAASDSVPEAWSISTVKGSDPSETFHVLAVSTGKKEGLNLQVRIQCGSKGIQPVQTIGLIAFTDVPIRTMTFRRQSQSQVQQAGGYMIGFENRSRVLGQIKPVDSMNGEELSQQFGIAALFSLGVQLFDNNGSLDKAAASYQRFIVNYYQEVFSGETLYIQVDFEDINGKVQTVSRSIDFSGAIAKRSAFLTSCGLKNPYQ